MEGEGQGGRGGKTALCRMSAGGQVLVRVLGTRLGAGVAGVRHRTLPGGLPGAEATRDP